MKQTINFILRAIFAISAAAGLAAAATAQEMCAHENPFQMGSGCDCPDGQYRVGLFGGIDNLCSGINPASSQPSEPPSKDAGGVTLILSPDVIQSAAFGNAANLYFVMINASGGDIRLSRTSGEYLYPQDTNFPRVPLSALTADIVVAANTEASFVLTMADPDDEIQTTMLGNGVLYYSMPAAADACGARGFADDTSDATRNNCNPFRTCGTGTTLNEGTNECDCLENHERASETMCIPTGGGGGGDNGGGGGNNGGGDNQRTSTPPQRGDHDYVPAIAGGVGILLLAGWQILTDGGDIDDFSFSPDFGYAITESGYSYKYGGRVDFRKDAWSLYWTAGQRNSNGEFGDFRYESGGEYDGGFWRAAFSESVVGETTDYDFSLSADYAGGIWRLSPEFFADARYANGEFAMTNSFRISGELRVDDWRFAASGSAERVRLSAVRRF